VLSFHSLTTCTQDRTVLENCLNNVDVFFASCREIVTTLDVTSAISRWVFGSSSPQRGMDSSNKLDFVWIRTPRLNKLECSVQCGRREGIATADTVFCKIRRESIKMQVIHSILRSNERPVFNSGRSIIIKPVVDPNPWSLSPTVWTEAVPTFRKRSKQPGVGQRK
jgi:hypothetical protein